MRAAAGAGLSRIQLDLTWFVTSGWRATQVPLPHLHNVGYSVFVNGGEVRVLSRISTGGAAPRVLLASKPARGAANVERPAPTEQELAAAAAERRRWAAQVTARDDANFRLRLPHT